VKNITLISKVFVLMAALSSTAIAQRTSTTVQTVAFGVHRSSLSVLSNLSPVQSAVHSPDGIQASTFQNVVSTYRIKVTFAALSMSGGNTASMTQYNTSSVESDVRSILASKELSSLNRTPLVATITE
jgi:hypothetical protein